MHKYISDFLQSGQDDTNFNESTKTYFPPWWRFWDRKIKTEDSYTGELSREFDQTGKLVRISRQRSKIHPGGFGEVFYWETLDLETLIATSHPYKNMEKKVFPDGKCREVCTSPTGEQTVAIGHVNAQGTLDVYANLSFKNGKQTGCEWRKKAKDIDLWKEVLTEFPVSLEEKAERLNRASQTFRQTNEAPQTEAELRAYKNAEERARFQENKRFSQNLFSKLRAKKAHKAYLSRIGARRGSP